MNARGPSEHTHADLMLAEQLRPIMTACLASKSSGRRSVLSNAQDRQLVSDDGRRPLTARVPHERPTSDSNPLWFGSGRYVRAIWTLSDIHIASIIARYAPFRDERRRSYATRLADAIAKTEKTSKTRHRARQIVLEILDGGDAIAVRQRLGIRADQWRDSNARRMYNALDKQLSAIDTDSLVAWGHRVATLKGDKKHA